MNTNFTLTTLLFLFLSTAAVFAQTNFKKGHIVEANGSIVEGLVDDRGDSRNSQRVSFKKYEDGAVKEYLPSDIAGYEVEGKVYETTEVDNYGQPLKVFLELINDGTLRLFYRRDQDDKMRFYAQKENQLHELTNESKETNVDGRTYRATSKAYIGILNAITNDCEIKRKEDLPYSLKTISALVASYNECKGDKVYKSERPEKNASIIKSVYVGLNRSRVVTTGADALFKETNTKSGFSAGIGYHINMPYLNYKLYIDLLAEYNQKGGTAETSRGNYIFDLHYLNFSPGLSYVYPKGKLRPVLGAGLVAGYLLNSESAYIRNRDGVESRIFFRPPFVDNEKAVELGYEVRGSLKYEVLADKFVFLRAKYGKSLIPFNYMTHSYFNHVVTFQVGYEF